VVPDGQRSATGKALTLNRPLRVRDHGIDAGYRRVTHDGTPADSVVIASYFVKDVDLFISGINAGANVGYQSMLTSGTVGAAFEAALKGYPALAVSVEARPDEWFNNEGSSRDYDRICDIVRDIVDRIFEKGFPAKVDILNLNFPCKLRHDIEIETTRPTRVRLANEVVERKDPHGRTYYWLKGIEVDAPEGTDVHAILKNLNISLSPITIEGTDEEMIEQVREFIQT
ncbi:5'/3'-nucleotidase SurE, partial [Candidatus Thorarchaeota archaeon]